MLGRMQEAGGREVDRTGCGDRDSGRRVTGSAGVEGRRYDSRSTGVRALPGRVQKVPMERRK